VQRWQSQRILIAVKMAGHDQIAQALQQAGRVCLSVLGKSMLPSLWPGDRVWIERADPHTLKAGDVVLVQLNSRSYVHRIQEIRDLPGGAHSFVTRGDAMPQADPESLAEQVLGKVTCVIRGQRRVAGVSNRTLWSRGMGGALAHCAPMASLASRLIDEKLAWKKRRTAAQRPGDSLPASGPTV
jgi:signal peptidase I